MKGGGVVFQGNASRHFVVQLFEELYHSKLVKMRRENSKERSRHLYQIFKEMCFTRGS